MDEQMIEQTGSRVNGDQKIAKQIVGHQCWEAGILDNEAVRIGAFSFAVGSDVRVLAGKKVPVEDLEFSSTKNFGRR